MSKLIEYVSKWILLWQRDPRWRWTQLGYGNCSIGSDGCVITCIAMMVGLMPDVVNQLLLRAGAFAGSLVYVPAINYIKIFGDKVRYVHSSIWSNDPLPDAEMNKLRAWLNNGETAMLCLDSRRDMKGIQYHYVLAVGVAEDNTIIVNDPYYNVTDKLIAINRIWWQRLLRGGYGDTDAKAIYWIHYFKRGTQVV